MMSPLKRNRILKNIDLYSDFQKATPIDGNYRNHRFNPLKKSIKEMGYDWKTVPLNLTVLLDLLRIEKERNDSLCKEYWDNLEKIIGSRIWKALPSAIAEELVYIEPLYPPSENVRTLRLVYGQ